MPAMHFVSTVLPAPLSPTSAITWPASARNWTPVSACTAPKCLYPSRTSSRCSLTCQSFLDLRRSGGTLCAPPLRVCLLQPVLRAELRVRPGADLALCQEAVLDHGLLDVRGGHRDGGLELRRRRLAR